jgi:hypothetical protein
MRLRKYVLLISALTIVVPLTLTTATADVQSGHDCSDGLPDGALAKLPAPLSKWGRVICTPIGQVMMAKDDWVWIMPDASGLVFVPSQVVETEPKEVGTEAYFTKVDVIQAHGAEFDQAYGTFHVGFDEKEVKPDAYRVDLTTVSGKQIEMFFFDYDTYAWGMSCPEGQCDPETRFMIISKNVRPEPRQPPI